MVRLFDRETGRISRAVDLPLPVDGGDGDKREAQ
jgi:hypothetical protein